MLVVKTHYRVWLIILKSAPGAISRATTKFNGDTPYRQQLEPLLV
jgi:hypothetical protein